MIALIKTFIRPIDWVLSIVIIPAAYLLWAYRRAGSAKLPHTTARLRQIGVFPLRNHYYEPLFDDSGLLYPLDRDRELPGIDLNDSGQMQLLDQLRYEEELKAMDLTKAKPGPDTFYLNNRYYEPGDAEFLYQFIRHTKPNKIIEIGSGNSTRIARLALLKNQAETGKAASHTCIEPYEQPWLEQFPGISVIRQRIEQCNLDWARELEPGDLLFVDSSHMVRPQGDVLKEYLEIFPLLQPGVYVHIHDVFTPKDYLKSWVVDDVRFWNEQYVMEALLTNTSRYQVVAAVNYLKHHHYESLARVCPYMTQEREPGSFYIRIKQ